MEAATTAPCLFPGTSPALLGAAEKTGTVPSMLQSMIKLLDVEIEVRRSLVRASLYPAFLILAASFLLPLPTLVTCGPAVYGRNVLVTILPFAGLALAGAAVRYAGPLARRNDLRLTYRPRVAVTAPEAALLAFPFVGAGETTATIETPAPTTEQDSFTARRLAAYFEWYYRRQSDLISPPWDLVKVGRVVKLPAVAAEQGQSGPIAALVAAPETALRLSADGQRLTLSGPTPDAREAALLRLLALLDHKYVCYGGMPSTPALIKAALAGKTLE